MARSKAKQLDIAATRFDAIEEPAKEYFLALADEREARERKKAAKVRTREAVLEAQKEGKLPTPINPHEKYVAYSFDDDDAYGEPVRRKVTITPQISLATGDDELPEDDDE